MKKSKTSSVNPFIVSMHTKEGPRFKIVKRLHPEIESLRAQGIIVKPSYITEKVSLATKWSATVAFFRVENNWSVGVALCNPKDVFDGNRGEKIAIGRAREEAQYGKFWMDEMFDHRIVTPEFPITLYRFLAYEAVTQFVETEISPNLHKKIFTDLNVPEPFWNWDHKTYDEWYKEQINQIIDKVYG